MVDKLNKQVGVFSGKSKIDVPGVEQNLVYFKYKRGVRLANRLLSSYKKKQFDSKELIEQAVKRTGLDDFGNEFFIEPLNALVEDLNRSTPFHPLGAFLYAQKLTQNLVNRLWAQYWLKREPGIKTSLPPALMITGLQRTGTTFLQRLLGSLPEFRGVISWEIINPVPTSQNRTYYGKYHAWLGHFALNYINPEMKSIHSIGYDALEEEVVLMEHSFMSSVIEASMSVPNYGLWLEQQDQTMAYRDLKMWLQFLLWRLPAPEYLLLKSPHHMEYLETFNKVFPNTHIIQMHRDPKETMASFCSMSHVAKKIFQPHSDTYEVGRHWLRKNQRLIYRCMEYRSNHNSNFTDIAYKDLTADPISTVKMIYQKLQLEWTPAHLKIANSFREQHRKNKFGKHHYTLADYGLSVDQIAKAFGEYYDRYGAYL